MLFGIVKAVAVVRHDFDSVAPRARGRVGFRVPNFAQQRSAVVLHGDHNETAAMFVPGYGAGVRRDDFVSAAVMELPARFVVLDQAGLAKLGLLGWADRRRVLAPGVAKFSLGGAVDFW